MQVNGENDVENGRERDVLCVVGWNWHLASWVAFSAFRLVNEINSVKPWSLICPESKRNTTSMVQDGHGNNATFSGNFSQAPSNVGVFLVAWFAVRLIVVFPAANRITYVSRSKVRCCEECPTQMTKWSRSWRGDMCWEMGLDIDEKEVCCHQHLLAKDELQSYMTSYIHG